MDLNLFTAEFLRKEEVKAFVKKLREKYDIDFLLDPQSDEYREVKTRLLKIGVSKEIESFLRRFYQEKTKDLLTNIAMVDPQMAADIPLKPLVKVLAKQIIEDIPDNMSFKDILEHKAISWLFDLVVYDPTEILLDFALTGETRPFKSEFQGRVSDFEFQGKKFLIALAHEDSDIEELTKEIKQKFKEVFGKKKNERERKNALRDAFFADCFEQGMADKDIADLFMERDSELRKIRFGSEEYFKKRKRIENLIKVARHRFEKR